MCRPEAAEVERGKPRKSGDCGSRPVLTCGEGRKRESQARDSDSPTGGGDPRHAHEGTFMNLGDSVFSCESGKPGREEG